MSKTPIEQRRIALVEAAFRVIAQHGLAATTVPAVVAEAGLPQASFHQVFKSREELMAQLIVAVTKSEHAAVFDAIQQSKSFVEMVQAALFAYLDFLVDDLNREQVLLELTLYALRNKELQGLPVEQYQIYRAAATGLAHYAAARWGMEWTIPIETVARHIVMITDGVTITWLVDHNTEEARNLLAAAAVSIAGHARPARWRSDQSEIGRS